MADLLIRGMKMPKSCAECRFFVDAWCYAFETEDWRNGYNAPPDGERLENCPLVALPDHGRLGDLDAIIAECKRRDEEAKKWAGLPETINAPRYMRLADVLDDAKTIIPASKEGGA